MADVHAPGQQGALPGEAQPTGPKILAGPPPGSGVERRVTDEAGEYALPPQGASSNISADASQAAEAAPQPPRVSGADAGAGEAQVYIYLLHKVGLLAVTGHEHSPAVPATCCRGLNMQGRRPGCMHRQEHKWNVREVI